MGTHNSTAGYSNPVLVISAISHQIRLDSSFPWSMWALARLFLRLGCGDVRPCVGQAFMLRSIWGRYFERMENTKAVDVHMFLRLCMLHFNLILPKLQQCEHSEKTGGVGVVCLCSCVVALSACRCTAESTHMRSPCVKTFACLPMHASH